MTNLQDRFTQPQKKVLGEDNDRFAEDESKDDLDLSQSQNNRSSNQGSFNQKDSLFFNF